MDRDATGPSAAARLDELLGRPEGRPLIGRRAELDRLAHVLDGALAQRGAVALVSGEAGVGKTRLAEATAELALECGFLVAWGRCWEGGGAPAWWAWRQALTILEEAVASRRRAPGAAEQASETVVEDVFRPMDTVAMTADIVLEVPASSEQVSLLSLAASKGVGLPLSRLGRDETGALARAFGCQLTGGAEEDGRPRRETPCSPARSLRCTP